MTISFVALPRVGGATQTSLMRLQGTVLGAMAGYLILALSDGSPVATTAALTAWVALASLARGSEQHSYTALVAAFTAPLIALGHAQAEGLSVREYATARIENTFLGVAAMALINNVVVPLKASAQAVRALTKAVDALAQGGAVVLRSAITGVRCEGDLLATGGRRRRPGSALPLRSSYSEECSRRCSARLELLAQLLQDVVSEPRVLSRPFPTADMRKLAQHLHTAADRLQLMDWACHRMFAARHTAHLAPALQVRRGGAWHPSL